MDESKIELIEERRLWSICSICNSEYSQDVRILPDCLHSFCFKCLSQSVTTSNACPHCNVQITTPILSLPPNYAIQTWLSLFSRSSISEYEHKLSNSISKMCEECESTNGEVYCKDCNRYYCFRCSKEVHLHRIMKTHNVGVISKLQYRTLHPAHNFYKCEKHKEEEKRLYCSDCEDFVCIYCLDINEAHCNHNTLSIFKFIELIKSKWQSNLQHEISEIQSKFPPKNKEENLQRKVLQISDEISKFQNELLVLQHKKEVYQKKLEQIQSFKFQFNVTNRFLRSFIFTDNLPLPLSSYLRKSSNENSNLQSENIKMKNEENIKRICDFFDSSNLKKIYSSFLPPQVNYNNENDHNLENNNNNNNDNQKPIKKSQKKTLSNYEIEKRNKMILTNKLSPNKNLILSFGSEGKGDYQFQKVHYLSVNSKADLIAVSDVSNNSIQTFGFDGILKNHYTSYTISNKKFNFKRPSGIKLLPKQNLIAVADQNDHQILMIDLTTSELKYAIGRGGKGEMSDQLFQPRGIATINQLDIIAICDCNNYRIQFFKLSTGEYHSSLSLNFRPYSIDLSKSAKIMVITDYDNHSVHLYSFITDDQQNFYYRAVKQIGDSRLTVNPRGIALHPKASYFVVATRKDLLFYTLSGDFICQFTPSPFAHSRPLAVNIDRKEHLIAVSDFFTSRVMLIKSPIFSQ